jgi:hypothetical protein
VYWKRVLWENAINADVLTEDFELDEADYGKLSFPFLTGHGFILDGSECSGQILREANLLPSGNILHFRSWGSGLRFVFPDETEVSAFGFDYQPSEDWRLIINNIIIDLPEGRKGFIGIVFFGNDPSKFSLTSLKNVQGGLSVDNISYVKSTLP